MSANFTSTADRLRASANKGLARAASSLAAALRARGLTAEVSSDAIGGRARVTIEAPDLRAREFGTLTRAANPIVAPIFRSERAEIARTIAAEILANDGT